MFERETDHRRRLRRLPAAAAALLICLVVCSSATAQRAHFAGSWLDEGADLKSAFREVVAEARGSTVLVTQDEQTLLLGTIVGEDGWIVTKGSEIPDSVRCRLPDGRELPAEIMGYDEETDLSLLKVDATDLAVVRWRLDKDPDVGDWLATVGQDERPIAVGIVSVPRRASPAVRISGVLGVRLEEVNGVARVDEIFADSAAERAKLQAGDQIVRVGNRIIDGRRALIRTIQENEPGTTLEITVQRDNEEIVLSATLTHPFGDFLSRIAAQNQMGGSLSSRRSGFPAILQHDTVLRPKECGGPVVDLNGDAIGINIARAGRTESFALPADVVVAVIDKLRSAATRDEQLATDAAPAAPEDADAAPGEPAGQ